MFRRDATIQIDLTYELFCERMNNGDLHTIASATGIDTTTLMDWYEDKTLVPTDDQLEALTFQLAADHYRSEASKLSLYQELNGIDPYNSSGMQKHLTDPDKWKYRS